MKTKTGTFRRIERADDRSSEDGDRQRGLHGGGGRLQEVQLRACKSLTLELGELRHNAF